MYSENHNRSAALGFVVLPSLRFSLLQFWRHALESKDQIGTLRDFDPEIAGTKR